MPETAFMNKDVAYEDILIELIKNMKMSKYPHQNDYCTACIQYLAPVLLQITTLLMTAWLSILALKLVRTTLKTSTTKALAVVTAVAFIITGKYILNLETQEYHPRY